MRELSSALLQISDELLLIVDPSSLKVIAAGPAGERLLGYAPGSLPGALITELECALPDLFFWEEVKGGHQPAIEGGSGLYRTQSGEILPVEKDIRPLNVEDRTLIAIKARVVQEEMETTTELERTAALMRATLEATADGILVTDLNGCIVNINRRFADLWALSDSLLAKGDDRLVFRAMARRFLRIKDWKQWTDEMRHAREQETFTLLQLRHNRWLECRSRPQMVSDQVIGHVYTFADISPRVQTQQALEQAMTRAEAANHAKTEFLNHMSHELRTPLNAIIGFAQLMQDEGCAPHAEKVDLILKGGWHLLNLINEVLDLASVEAGKMSLLTDNVDLNGLAAECIALVSSLADKYHIRLHNKIDDGVMQVRADPGRLRQILLNLLSNAIKYNRQKGEVWLEAKGQDNGTIRICVRDNGIGISEADQQRLFESFTRVGNKQHRIEGTGIGLALTRKLVQMMQGQIGLNSCPGAGSTFWIELPAVTVDIPNIPAQKLASISTEIAQRILYIEDEPSSRRLMVGALRRHPHLSLLVAENGEEGIHIALEAIPDLLIIDGNLGDMSGPDILKAIKNHEKTQNIPAFVLSASSLPEEIEAAKIAGFDRYLTKPVKIPELLRAIEDTARRQRQG